MIELAMHTDNWRPLSQSFAAAVDKIRALGMKHVEFAVIHGQYFISAMGYDPGTSRYVTADGHSNPRQQDRRRLR